MKRRLATAIQKEQEAKDSSQEMRRTHRETVRGMKAEVRTLRATVARLTKLNKDLRKKIDAAVCKLTETD